MRGKNIFDYMIFKFFYMKIILSNNVSYIKNWENICSICGIELIFLLDKGMFSNGFKK